MHTHIILFFTLRLTEEMKVSELDSVLSLPWYGRYCPNITVILLVWTGP